MWSISFIDHLFLCVTWEWLSTPFTAAHCGRGGGAQRCNGGHSTASVMSSAWVSNDAVAYVRAAADGVLNFICNFIAVIISQCDPSGRMCLSLGGGRVTVALDWPATD